VDQLEDKNNETKHEKHDLQEHVGLFNLKKRMLDEVRWLTSTTRAIRVQKK